MKHILTGFAAFLLSAAVIGPPAQAQAVPQGSYLRSCNEVRMEGGALTALCRRADGRWDRTVLNNVRSCAGDIGNSNGALICNRGPGYGAGRVEERRELRREEHQLRCEGLLDPFARERCLHGF